MTALMSRRVRVFQVITAFTDDAPAQSAAVLAKYLDTRKFEVTAISLRDPGASRTVADLERSHIPHIAMGMNGFMDVAAVLRFARCLRQARPDIVHTHAFRADLWCGLASRLAGVPLLVNTIRNHDADVFRMERPRMVAELAVGASRLASALAHELVAVSAGIADYLSRGRRVPSEKIHVIRNGFDFERLDAMTDRRADVRRQMGWQDDDVVIGTLAVLKPRKGLGYLVQAARTVLSAQPQARFFIAGEGPDRASLEAEIARAGIQARFQMLGHRRDALELLAASDIYTLPSVFEGLPRSLLEAMALSKPAVVTDIGGSREVVHDGESGLVVPPCDGAALAGALCRLVRSPELRGRCGAIAHDLVQARFDARHTAHAHEAVYQRALAKRRARTRRDTAREGSAGRADSMESAGR